MALVYWREILPESMTQLTFAGKAPADPPHRERPHPTATPPQNVACGQWIARSQIFSGAHSFE